MKGMSIPTRIYILSIYTIGALFLFLNLFHWQIREPVMLTVLCTLASLALIIKVEGTTNRSHYTFSFILYGFAFTHFGIPGAAIVIFISNLVEWLVKRPPWFIQIFNTACYVIVINVAGFIFSSLNPNLSLATPTGILAITASMVVFTLLNHLIVGIIVWMARGENFQKSGIFDLLPLIIDLTLLTFGAMLVLIWEYSPFALLLFVFPIYLIYGTMRVPALERQSETDPKTGLFNHAYFKQHLENELRRANRFDRPLTVIMADLDLLRNINNTYGHLAGDEVLIGIANILKQAVREYDVVARFGGEEFTILMPETTLEQGYKRAETIREAVEKAEFVIPTSVTPIKATLSLGIANREYFSQTGQDIIHNADTALYHSKLKGRNRTYAYTQEAYVDFARLQREAPIPNDEVIDRPPDTNRDAHEASTYQAAEARMISASQSEPASQAKKEAEASTPSSSGTTSKTPVYIFIGGLFIFSLVLFSALYLIAPSLYTDISTQSWLGMVGCVTLVILTEWYSIDLYTKQTSLSTSAVPILAGTLLFGPVGSFALSLTYALSTGIKHHSPLNRIIFNFSNQLIAGMVYTLIIYSTGKPFIGLSTQIQVILAVIAAVIVYGINTALISIGMHLDTRQPAVLFWKEHYSWLFSIYIGMGIVAAAFVFGYKHDPVIGSLLVIAPLLLLRVSQVQYVERTRGMVSEMRVKNTVMEKYSDEITRLNDGLLDTLAEIIDLRDPYVLGHSRGVTGIAVKLAKRLGLHEKQIELVRKGSMLHDIGKLGISQEILAKPAPLTPEEYKIIQKHPKLGAALLEKSPHLRPLIPIVLHHHEFYNGEGYPDGISENQIAIEARIVSVADAIEAMSSDRPYRKARTTEFIIEELQRCSSTQFDPLVADTAIQILKEMESAKHTEEAIEYAKAELQKSTSQLRSFDAA
jgi:diguanylate cyclase (GGDEF)-like protein/putative nucleotidyltransferase with HDIG domain